MSGGKAEARTKSENAVVVTRGSGFVDDAYGGQGGGVDGGVGRGGRD